MMTRRNWKVAAVMAGLAFVPWEAKSADKGNDSPGPIDSLQDLQDTGKIIFKIADENNDGFISQREANDAGNLAIGGFFFRIDTNGDGVVSQDELRQARETFFAQKPWARVVFERAKKGANGNGSGSGSGNPQNLMALIDTNNDGKIQSSEVRQLVDTSVQSVYAVADTNRDGQLSPIELNAAIMGAARGVVQAALKAADTDGNGQISEAEFNKALAGPARIVFAVLDGNGDGQISREEARNAAQVAVNQLKLLNVPEPANSPKHLLESGRTPDQVAPVPNVNASGTRPIPPAR
jgi:Ca2+-binding EF-hand superfamily protein